MCKEKNKIRRDKCSMLCLLLYCIIYMKVFESLCLSGLALIYVKERNMAITSVQFMIISIHREGEIHIIYHHCTGPYFSKLTTHHCKEYHLPVSTLVSEMHVPFI